MVQMLDKGYLEEEKKGDMDSLKLIQQMQEEDQMVKEAIREALEHDSLKEFKCKICLDALTNNEEVIPLTLCEHIFHSNCL